MFSLPSIDCYMVFMGESYTVKNKDGTLNANTSQDISEILCLIKFQMFRILMKSIDNFSDRDTQTSNQ